MTATAMTESIAPAVAEGVAAAEAPRLVDGEDTLQRISRELGGWRALENELREELATLKVQ